MTTNGKNVFAVVQLFGLTICGKQTIATYSKGSRGRILVYSKTFIAHEVHVNNNLKRTKNKSLQKDQKS